MSLEIIADVTRRGGCARVTFESGESMRVPNGLYLLRRLVPGRPLDTAEYLAWRKQYEFQVALERAVKYLEGRERSAGEVRECLLSRGYTEEVTERVILTLTENRFLSDSRFAGLWVDARAQKLGRNRIRQELNRKGVDGDTVRAALETFSEEDELENAVLQARKLMRRENDPRRLLAALQRKGYSYSIAKNALKRAGTETETEDGEAY